MNKKVQKSMTKQSYVDKDMTIGDVVEKYPESADIMLEHGLHCIGCHVNPFETIEMGAKSHGIDDKTIEKMIKDINKKISETSNESMKMPKDETIEITEIAISKTKELIKKENKDQSYGLRIGITEGGCAGFSYNFSFENKKRDDDKLIEKKGLKIFIDKEAMSKLSGSTIDFVDTLHGSGFKVKNPNAHTSCGCGNSFG